jgi:hypothetical protein
MKILAADSMKLNKSKTNLETDHAKRATHYDMKEHWGIGATAPHML